MESTKLIEVSRGPAWAGFTKRTRVFNECPSPPSHHYDEMMMREWMSGNTYIPSHN